ncbi:MAG: hypothetical protein M1823_002477 [Watsoniomyces obsoletus]|nr:MAG: hypothetical protein M1823_002477 [Watsoniomyces obsoletus]
MNPPTIWRPYRVLEHMTEPGRYEMFCVGRAAGSRNARCRWTIEGATYTQVVSILNEMATRLPNNVADLLPGLARLSLCEGFHQGQQYGTVARWTTLVREKAEELEETLLLGEQNGQLRSELASVHERLETMLQENSEVSSIETGLRSQLKAEQEARIHFENESNQNTENLHAELGHVQAQFTAERQRTERQAEELRTLQEQNTALSSQLSSNQALLKRRQFELEQNQKIHEEQLAGVLARNAALLEQNREWEARLAANVLDRFCRYVKRVAAGCVPRLRPAPTRWQKVDSGYQLG